MDMISLDDLILRHDLDPRLGDRDDDLVAQYAEIFATLPAIEINQHNEVIDGWHRYLAARRAGVPEIAYVVVETDGDADLSDRMYAANLRHGVQYSRDQKRAYGVRLHRRDLSAKEIARLSGVGVSTVYRWTKEHRDQERLERDSEIARLRDDGFMQQEIADELGIAQSTVAEIIGDSHLRISDKEPECESEPEIEGDKEEVVEEAEEAGERTAVEQSGEPEPDVELLSAESDVSDVPADEQPDTSESEPDTVEASADEVSSTPEDENESEPSSPEEIPAEILDAARTVMGAFAEVLPEGYVARLEASSSEWMTITDDSLSNDLERELLSSAAAMCLWREQMIWYQGANAGSFTDAFGKIGPVFVRGRAGQWSIVSQLRSIIRRLWA